jgi:hypothetical protein
VFKVAGKWATWQHIAKLPDNPDRQEVRDRAVFSSYVLGRFHNGTLYNGLCGAVGAYIGRFFSSLAKEFGTLPTGTLCILLGFEALILGAILLASLFKGWPGTDCKTGMPILKIKTRW